MTPRITVDDQTAAPSVTRAAIGRRTGRPMCGPDKGHVEGAFDQPYAIPNYRVASHLAALDVPTKPVKYASRASSSLVIQGLYSTPPLFAARWNRR